MNGRRAKRTSYRAKLWEDKREAVPSQEKKVQSGIDFVPHHPEPSPSPSHLTLTFTIPTRPNLTYFSSNAQPAGHEIRPRAYSRYTYFASVC